MEIKQFEDRQLSHYSYAIVSEGEMALIDPSRNPEPYFDFADQVGAKVVAVIETHPHADFVSSHLEIHNTKGATIYVSGLLKAEYPHHTFDEGDVLRLGNVSLMALNTPGHSPDSISIVLRDEEGREKAVFTGDTLFIGDCGRPDLREKAGAITATREELAGQMYYSLRNKLINLPDDVLVYPAHGAGSLCGKGLAEQNYSTIGAEKISNWSLQDMSGQEFVTKLLSDQPFVPKYFPFDVEMNKRGADNYSDSIKKVKICNWLSHDQELNLDSNIIIIDTRPSQQFKKGHLRDAINLPDDNSFETWLGSIVNPWEPFYLVGENEGILNNLIGRIAKIGYEKQISLAWVSHEGHMMTKFFDSEELRSNPNAFTIIDTRNDQEVRSTKIFTNALHIPLYELRERINEIPLHKPIVVHCASGYRSAAGASIIDAKLGDKVEVYDLSDSVKNFQR